MPSYPHFFSESSIVTSFIIILTDDWSVNFPSLWLLTEGWVSDGQVSSAAATSYTQDTRSSDTRYRTI